MASLIAVRQQPPPLARLRAAFVLWCALPITALTLLPTSPYIHYFFIVLLPLPYFGSAHLIGTRPVRLRRCVRQRSSPAARLHRDLMDPGASFRTMIHDGGAPATTASPIATARHHHSPPAAQSGRRIRIERGLGQRPTRSFFGFLIWMPTPTERLHERLERPYVSRAPERDRSAGARVRRRLRRSASSSSTFRPVPPKIDISVKHMTPSRN